ncbi:MAG: carboxypeptidase regulatory-like domain-containing protein [Bacteroidota bacterium]
MRAMRYFLLAAACVAVVGGAIAQTPPAPINLTAHVSMQIPPVVELTWQLPPIMIPVPPGVFRVYRAVDDSTAFQLLDVTHLERYADRQVAFGHTYFYVVTNVWLLPDSTVHESGKSNLAWARLGPPPGGVAGEVNGTVTDSLTGNPIPFARVSFYNPWRSILWIPMVVADSVGHYSAVLDTGRYLIKCEAPAWMIMSMSILPPYRTEWYKDSPDAAHATPVQVSEGSVTTIDFDLIRFPVPPLAHVRGLVRDSSGNPLRGAFVAIQRTIQEMSGGLPAVDGINSIPGEMATFDGLGCIRGVVWKGLTDSSGAFDALVVSGRAYVAMAVKAGFMPQYYDHKDNPAEATTIHVTGDVDNINFDLNPFRPPHMYSISGVVQDSGGVRVPSRIIVFPLRPHASYLRVRFGHTDSLGAYVVGRLLPGKYFVMAIPFGKYAPAFYKAGAFGVFRWKEADTVTVAGDVSGIDIGVVRVNCTGIARLWGFIRFNGRPLAGANLLARNGVGAVVGFAMSDDAGMYVMEGLPAGGARIIVDCEGYNSAEQEITVGPFDYALSRDFTLGAVTSAGTGSVRPERYALEQNYPNPFNPSTRISFALPAASTVMLRVYNLLGQEIATLLQGFVPPGNHEAVWNGRDNAGHAVTSGVYFYRLEAAPATGGERFVSTRKMLMIK